MKELEKLINALETENRSRGKRHQPPLTYNEAYSMLTQLLGGDVCQSANLKFDIFASGSDGKYTIPRLREDSGSKGKGGQNSHQQHRKDGKGGGGSRSANGGNRSDETWTATADMTEYSTSFSSILLIPSFYTIQLVFFLNVRWGGWVAGLIKTNTSPSKAELAAGRC